jgi:hypothetical protein
MVNIKSLKKGQIIKAEPSGQDVLKGYYVVKDLPILLNLIWVRKTNTLYFRDDNVNKTEKEFKEAAYLAEDQVSARKEVVRLIYNAVAVKLHDTLEIFKSI